MWSLVLQLGPNGIFLRFIYVVRVSSSYFSIPEQYSIMEILQFIYSSVSGYCGFFFQFEVIMNEVALHVLYTSRYVFMSDVSVLWTLICICTFKCPVLNMLKRFNRFFKMKLVLLLLIFYDCLTIQDFFCGYYLRSPLGPAVTLLGHSNSLF